MYENTHHIYMCSFMYICVFNMCAVRPSFEMSRKTCIYEKRHVKRDVYAVVKALTTVVKALTTVVKAFTTVVKALTTSIRIV